MVAIICYMFVLWTAFMHVLSQDTDAFDWKIGNTSLWLSAAAYCETNTYLNRSYLGYSQGFIPLFAIDRPEFDVQAFIGYMPSQNAIYTTFRGSTSIEDWINNVEVRLIPYPRCEKCYVHDGFYQAERSVNNLIINMLQSSLILYPQTKMLIFTGHSLGGAMATLTALEMILDQITTLPIRLYHFGSPRVGNPAFAMFASDVIIDRNRATHLRDVVPHLPWHERYMHISGISFSSIHVFAVLFRLKQMTIGEWYEDAQGILHACSGYEDPHCAYQWYLLTVEDHMSYLGLNISCEAVSSHNTSTGSANVFSTRSFSHHHPSRTYIIPNNLYQP